MFWRKDIVRRVKEEISEESRIAKDKGVILSLDCEVWEYPIPAPKKLFMEPLRQKRFVVKVKPLTSITSAYDGGERKKYFGSYDAAVRYFEALKACYKLEEE